MSSSIIHEYKQTTESDIIFFTYFLLNRFRMFGIVTEILNKTLIKYDDFENYDFLIYGYYHGFYKLLVFFCWKKIEEINSMHLEEDF